MFYFNPAVIKLMNYNNCYNKTPFSALYIEHKHQQPLGSASDAQKFHKTLQHLTSKKTKQNIKVIQKFNRYCVRPSCYSGYEPCDHRSVIPKLSKCQTWEMIVQSHVLVHASYIHTCIYIYT